LAQAKQYMIGENMQQQAEAAIAKLSQIIAVMNDDAQVNAYKAELDKQISQYADWYFTEYRRMHIT
jgi:hypothetical protein